MSVNGAKNDIILKTHEKAIEYARNLLGEGEIMNAKSVLDHIYKQLHINNSSITP
jgi:hypothetical protein